MNRRRTPPTNGAALPIVAMRNPPAFTDRPGNV